MKLIKLYEEVLGDVHFNYEVDDERVEIIALKDRKVVGKIVLVFVMDAWHEFEDAIEKGDMSEEDYYKIFPNDSYANIEYLNVEDSERGQGFAKMLMNKAVSHAKREGEKVMYLNASPMGISGLNINDLVGFYKSFGFQTLIDSGHNVEMFMNI